MSSHHHHGHHHNHSHVPEGSDARIATAFALNLVFTIIEFIGGVLTNSTAIMADAVHDLGDSLSIGMAWFLARQSRKQASPGFTYGYRRLSLLGAAINGLVLVVGSIWVLTAAIPRLWAPEMPHAQGMFALAILGVLVNGVAAWRLSGGKTLNERVLNWHLIEDVLGWVAVLIVSVVLMFVDWPILDPLLSLAFTVFILVNVVRTLRLTVKLFLQANPDIEETEKLRAALLDIEHVADLHHLHVWSLDGEHNVMTAHLLLDVAISRQVHARVKQAVDEVVSGYGFAHTTVELEQLEERCRDEEACEGRQAGCFVHEASK